MPSPPHSSANWPDESVFEPFTIIEKTYKTIGSHPLRAAVLIPKGLAPGPHPVIVNIHGGFLMTAHALFAPFFHPWVSDLAVAHAAIIVSPDYRLLPSPGDGGVADVVADLEDFWHWMHDTLPGILGSRGYKLDFTRLIMTGGSAGGYGVLQLALSHPDDVAVVAVVYPLIDLEDPVFVSGPEPGAPTVMRFPPENIPSEEETLRWVEQTKEVASKAGFERTPYAVGVTQYGYLYSRVFNPSGSEAAELFPLRRIEAGARLPKKVWILHGDDDSVVYIRASHKFVDLVKEKLPETEVRLDVAQGQDHAICELQPDWEARYAQGGMEFVKKSWLGEVNQ